MRLKELKCKNCGATLEVEENAQQVKCKFCNTTFAVEDAYTDGYKYEKGRLKAQNEQLEKHMENAKGILAPVGKVFAAHYIITAVVGIVIFLIIAIIGISMVFSFNKDKDNIKNNNDAVVEDMENFMSEFDIRVFNNNFEMYKGTEYGSSVGRLLDEISTNNKKNAKNQVTVVFKETTTKDPEEMKNIKKQLGDWTEYEVSFDYNDAGLIYQATIEE